MAPAILAIIVAFCLVLLALTVFGIWMFIDMLLNKSISPLLKIIWVLGFVFISLVAAAVYYFDEYKHKKLPKNLPKY
jgi:hypothetical protein